MKQIRIVLVVLLSIITIYSYGASCKGFDITLFIEGQPANEYHEGGKIYIEAVKNKNYAIRITNPLSCRVAVALSVDGLNTIDAKRTNSKDAAKWVLDPHEIVFIYGWQVNGEQARNFFFTSEEKSYGAYLGKTENLGTIEAQFFREKAPVIVYQPKPLSMRRSEEGFEGGVEGEVSGGLMEKMAPAPQSVAKEADSSKSDAEIRRKDEYAATGIGEKVEHSIQWIALDLEKSPSSIISIRYEFRPQLVKLGILPKGGINLSPLERRENARGFEYSYCPDPFDKRR